MMSETPLKYRPVSDLQRFVDAQAHIFETALAELHKGQKRTHWMWYIFPQIQGLGMSPTSVRYAIADADEAVAYWEHAVLGQRLQQSTECVLEGGRGSISDVFGNPDDLKFRSSMTLFAQCVPSCDVFQRALDRFFEGQPDQRTINILEE
jgi:uncharacterized protein (DUF1810 family)